jgi:hypothetical protein
MTPELETVIDENMPRYLAYLAAITPARRAPLEAMTYNPGFLQTLEWEITSKVNLYRNPWCAHCGRPAKVSHHRYYWAGRLALESLQSLCHNCHF